jgi:hypothetical protein
MGDQLKFLVGVGVGKKVEKWLIENGYDAKFVRDINPKAKDSEILSIAIIESRIYKVMEGELTQVEAAEILKLSERQIGRIVKRIKEDSIDPVE